MNSRVGIAGAFSLACGAALWVLATAQTPANLAQAVQLQEARNLGKAFYETPGSSRQAVEQLRKALELNPGSAREHLNYGLALLRAGERDEGMAQITEAQKIDRSLPHTYFNLGIEFKKAGEAEKAIDQLLQMERLRPLEAKTQYNLGALYKQIGNMRRAIEKFEAHDRPRSVARCTALPAVRNPPADRSRAGDPGTRGVQGPQGRRPKTPRLGRMSTGASIRNSTTRHWRPVTRLPLSPTSSNRAKWPVWTGPRWGRWAWI